MITGNHVSNQKGIFVTRREWDSLVSSVNRLRALDFDGTQFTTSKAGNGFHVTLNNAPGGTTDNTLTFTTTVAGLSMIVSAGTLRIHEINIYPVAAITFAMTGDPCWVYVEHLRDGSSTAITFSAAEPISNSTSLRIPLCKCRLLATGAGYYKEKTCHVGDINFSTPL